MSANGKKTSLLVQGVNQNCRIANGVKYLPIIHCVTLNAKLQKVKNIFLLASFVTSDVELQMVQQMVQNMSLPAPSLTSIVELQTVKNMSLRTHILVKDMSLPTHILSLNVELVVRTDFGFCRIWVLRSIASLLHLRFPWWYLRNGGRRFNLFYS